MGTPECPQLWDFWYSILYHEEHFDVLLQVVGALSPPPQLNHQVFPPPFVWLCVLLEITQIHTGLQQCKLTLSEVLRELENVNTNCSFAQTIQEA